MNTPARPVPAARRAPTAASPAFLSTEADPVHRRRNGIALCTAGLAMAAAVVMSAPGALGTTVTTENATAAAVVRAITDDDPDATSLIPNDFVLRVGYLPAMRDGILVNPSGDCSSPVTLPAEFDTACMAHDLGYDMLRYADRLNEPLGPWARKAVDGALNRRIHAACGARDDDFARARCGVMADIAFTAVDVNSRRQEYGVPVVENVFAVASSDDPPNLWPLARTSLGLFAVLGACAVIFDAIRKRRRRFS
ncbi:hypothetical protein [Nocardia camponoti]|uniref:Phospholipase n=1 Tax=Nocardia camponoti TaxID=1616106 RepID=A0A917V696_9NOCA|nr:hypothetical protein [Nocardia camponoti]GGK43887.1 hypothetical protein GCM10011591_14350 [Nocardia camponoti]